MMAEETFRERLIRVWTLQSRWGARSRRGYLRHLRQAILTRNAVLANCPGQAEYGHGLSRTTVHGDCCAAARAKMNAEWGLGDLP